MWGGGTIQHGIIFKTNVFKIIVAKKNNASCVKSKTSVRKE